MTRRRFIAAGVVLAGLGMIAAGGYALSGSGQTDFAKYLADLDKRIASGDGINLLSQQGPEIVQRSVDQVGRYLGTNTTAMASRFRLFTDSDSFLAANDQLYGCHFGLSATAEANTIGDYPNRQTIVRLTTETASTQAATHTAEKVVHDAIHNLTRNRKFTPADMNSFLPNLDYDSIDGLMLTYYEAADQTRNACTAYGLRLAASEAVVQYSAIQVLSAGGVKIGADGYQPKGYPDWTKTYTINIGSRFLQDHRDQLLIPFLEVKPTTYFTNLGRRIDPKNANPAELGQRFVLRLLPDPEA